MLEISLLLLLTHTTRGGGGHSIESLKDMETGWITVWRGVAWRGRKEEGKGFEIEKNKTTRKRRRLLGEQSLQRDERNRMTEPIPKEETRKRKRKKCSKSSNFKVECGCWFLKPLALFQRVCFLILYPIASCVPSHPEVPELFLLNTSSGLN